MLFYVTNTGVTRALTARQMFIFLALGTGIWDIKQLSKRLKDQTEKYSNPHSLATALKILKAYGYVEVRKTLGAHRRYVNLYLLTDKGKETRVRIMAYLTLKDIHKNVD